LPKRQSAFRAREIGKDRRAFFLHFRVFGILEMISTIEKEFRIQLDLADLDVEQITILGPLSRYVAGRGWFRPESFSNFEDATG
jgi:hypothetical protein